MTEGRSFQLGLKQPIERPVFERSWYHLDNGFSSATAMNELHEPIIALAGRTLTGVTGTVLDLGCGNAALLAKLCEGRSRLTPYGVDTSSAALAHAGVLLPRVAANFTLGDLFNPDILNSGSPVLTAGLSSALWPRVTETGSDA
jgi:SAM-dependent methyltransferase